MLSSSAQCPRSACFEQAKEPARVSAMTRAYIGVLLLPLLTGFLVVCAAKQAPATASRQGPPPASQRGSMMCLKLSQSNKALKGFVTAAGPVRGVGALGHGPPAQAAPPPRPAYGGAPGDYARGYEGMNPMPGDFWHRESDFRARNYTTRHGPPPIYAAPPQSPPGGGGGRVIEPYDPILPKPPLPGDSDPPARVRPVAPKTAPSKNK